MVDAPHKSQAQSQVTSAQPQIRARSRDAPLEILEQALDVIELELRPEAFAEALAQLFQDVAKAIIQ